MMAVFLTNLRGVFGGRFMHWAGFVGSLGTVFPGTVTVEADFS